MPKTHKPNSRLNRKKRPAQKAPHPKQTAGSGAGFRRAGVSARRYPGGSKVTAASDTLAERKKHWRRRVHLGDALRKKGLDEYKVAEEMVGVVDRLGKGGEDKLLLDALKESSRFLLDSHSKKRATAASDAPVPVNLVHCVPRPAREQTKSS